MLSHRSLEHIEYITSEPENCSWRARLARLWRQTLRAGVHSVVCGVLFAQGL